MQNAGITELGLPWKYLAFDVLPTDLPSVIHGAAAMRYVGLNLTVPHKLLAVPLMDELDVSAREWGAVNTVLFEGCSADGKWLPITKIPAENIEKVRSRGYNTDADAIVRAIQEAFELRSLGGSTILLLGAGGAARAAALRLAAEQPAKLHLINRTPEKAEALAIEIRERYPGVKAEVGYPAGSADIVLNGTSLGLKDSDGLPLDETLFPLTRSRMVYDMIYKPAETRLLVRAKELGCRTSNGLGMLLYQGARALELWSGKPAPVEVMKSALQKAVLGVSPSGRIPGNKPAA